MKQSQADSRVVVSRTGLVSMCCRDTVCASVG